MRKGIIMRAIDEQEFHVEIPTGMKLMVKSKTPTDGRSGKAVLLVHGSGVGWIYWDIPFGDYSIMNYLARRGLDVYAVECRGYGESTKPNGSQITITTITEDLPPVLSAIQRRSDVNRVSMAGHSSGGMVLLMAGGMFPEFIDRLILMGTPYKKINTQFMEYARTVIAMSGEPGNDYVDNLHHKDIENRLDDHEDEVVAWYKKTVDERYSKMPGGLFPDLLDSPGARFVPQIKAPTLVMNGSEEYVVEQDDAENLFRDLGTKDKSFIIQPGGFHLMFLEKLGHRGLQESIFFWVTKTS